MGFLERMFGGQKSVFGDEDSTEPADILKAARQASYRLESNAPSLLTYPGADTSISMTTHGTYRKGFPEGAVVHYTAGRFEKGDASAAATMRYGAKKHCYFCISTSGKVYQGAPLDRWGSHAGASYREDLGKWVSQYLVGIEICSAGLLKETPQGLMPWWGRPPIPEALCRKSEIGGNINLAGWYHAYTPEQETALEELLLWLHASAPDIFSLDRVLGHDEVATPAGRKNDPGGALSVSMSDFRARLKSRAAASPSGTLA